MSIDHMGVTVEVWPVAADQTGIWLLSGSDAWRDEQRLQADTTVHAEVELLLHANGVDLADLRGLRDISNLVALHSTSWRQAPGNVQMTYLAIVECDGLVRETWPEAMPITELLPDAVGRPAAHGAAEQPDPRRVDVLLHALRDLLWGLEHLRFLSEEDAAVAAALSDDWRRALEPFRPALSNMYRPHTIVPEFHPGEAEAAA